MVSLERLLGNELFYYDDVASFVCQVKKILGEKEGEDRYRQIAMNFDWKVLALHYESVLEEAA
jgi:hypothetical protein